MLKFKGTNELIGSIPIINCPETKEFIVARGPLRITCVIDSLNCGGAQRQMVYLVNLLGSYGHDVTLLTFHKLDHFASLVDKSSVRLRNVVSGKFSRPFKIRRLIRKLDPDVVISYLSMPNVLSVFATMPPNRIPLIVSERSFDFGKVTWGQRLRYLSYRNASFVVANSMAQTSHIIKKYPALRDRTVYIPNCIDLEVFSGGEVTEECKAGNRLIVVANVQPLKNAETLIEAVGVLRQKREIIVNVDWFGRFHSQDAYCKSLVAKVHERNLEGQFRFLGSSDNMAARYREYDALCLPSKFEGCANVVCEAMAVGLPVIASKVGDNPILVREGENGFLFDSSCVESLADALTHFMFAPAEQRARMGANGRNFAEENLCFSKFGASYMDLIRRIV